MAITMDADRVTNKVKYIPVADATAGSMPVVMSTGLKMKPVPVPQQDPTDAPKKAIELTLDVFLRVHSKSP
jgi:hypothetical protein